MELPDAQNSVREFYNGSVILITGGTGFVGKVLIERLLRVYKVKKIYLIIRRKNNMDCDSRLKEFFKETIFDKLNSEAPDAVQKVVPIEVNFSSNDLNISESNKNIICNEVEIVFNVVASVKFNEKIRDAVEINVLGTKRILDLVMEMKHLKTLLHVSTLYSSCDRKFIAEKVYEHDIGYEKFIELTRSLGEAELNKMQNDLLGKMPNTYTLTKRCSENLVNHRAHYLPAGIFRPPVVISTYKEPIAGWTDNLYGPAGVSLSLVRGLNHVLFADSRKIANVAPVDYCISAMIAATWDISKRYNVRINDQSEMPVYNYAYDKNTLTWGKFMKMVQYGLYNPLQHAWWYFTYALLPSKTVFTLTEAIVNTVPSYLLDGFAYCTGRKQIYRIINNKIHELLMAVSYFGIREWEFENRNVRTMGENLQGEEKHELQFDITTIDWMEYFHFYMPGIKKYFCKEKINENVSRSSVLTMHFYLKYMLLIILTSTSFMTLSKFRKKYIAT